VGGCGGFLNSNTGGMQSLGYPDISPNNVDCTWVIPAQKRKVFKCKRTQERDKGKTLTLLG